MLILCLLPLAGCLPLFNSTAEVTLSEIAPVDGGYKIELYITEETDLSEYSLGGSRLNGTYPAGYAVLQLPTDSAPGDSITLLKEGTEVDSVVIPELKYGASYACCAGEWRFFAFSTFGKAQNGGADTLENAFNSPTAGLVISEVFPSAWVELHNISELSLQLDNYSVGSSLTDMHALPAITVKPGEYIVLENRITGIQPSQQLFLSRLETVLSTVCWNESINKEYSVSGNGMYYYMPTPGSENGTSISGYTFSEGKSALRINEVMPKNTLSVIFGTRRLPWAELYNTTDTAVSTAGYFLSDNTDNPCVWPLPVQTVPSGGYILIPFGTGEGQAPFALSERLVLCNSNDMIYETLSIPSDIRENVSLSSEGRYAVPTPLTVNAKATETARPQLSGLYISEVCSVHPVRSGENDMIELYNASDREVNLTGLFLTDKLTKPEKYPLSGTVSAQGYKLIGREGDTLSVASAGETLYLTDGSKLLDVFETPHLMEDYTAGRCFPNGTVLLLERSLGKANGSSGLKGICPSPVFSADGGYYEEGLELKMSCPEGGKIYYTLDGSAPTKMSALYRSPVKISSTTAVRAMCVMDNYADSLNTVGTFRTGKDKHTLPVVCMTIDKSDLTYICASESRLDIRERNGYTEYYNTTGQQLAAFPSGFSIGGAGTRSYAQKSFNIHLRGYFGQNTVQAQFFEDFGINEFSCLVLRNSGQDISTTRIRDAFVSMAVNGLNINNAQTRFAVLYLNGKYHGLYELKENQNEDYFVSHTGCDRESVQLVRANTNVYNKQGSNDDIVALYKYAHDNNFADDEKYAVLADWIDEKYYTDYLICIAFFLLTDAYNQKSTRAMDGTYKWQPVFYDLDISVNTNYKSQRLKNFFKKTGITTGSGYVINTSIFAALYENAGWRERFVERYCELLNTTLSTDRLLAMFDKMVAEVEPEMPRNIERWNKPATLEEWRGNIAAMRTAIECRRDYAADEMKKMFGVSDERLSQLIIGYNGVS